MGGQAKNSSKEEQYTKSSVYHPTTNYDKNSSVQKSVHDAAKFLIHEAISKNMELEKLCTAKTICIADLGCAVGPNTILAIEEIIQTVEKYINSTATPEFQVFFSDIPTNDFNTLFQYLPINRKYYAFGVPGSFYGRIFPARPIHFAHSSYALQWLSRVPEDVMDEGSSCWNKGNIYYSHVRDEVAKAYAKLFDEDFECFLEARAHEVVHGGLVAIIIPARGSNGVSHSQVINNMSFNFLGECLLELSNKGLVQEEKIDSFNIPVYHPTLEEMEKIVQRNGYFNIERNEGLPWKRPQISENQRPEVQISKVVRAIMEGPIGAHFGYHIVDPLFDLYTKKLEQESATIAAADVLAGFMLLKRKSMD